jgi:hypothetical protein
MKITILLLMILCGTLAFAQDDDQDQSSTDQAGQFHHLNQQKGQADQKNQKKDNKGPSEGRNQKDATAGTYHSPFDSDISKTSFGATANPFAQASVTNANPQHQNGLPALDFHHKQAHQSSTSHDTQQDKKTAAKAPYDPGEYKKPAAKQPIQ